jgi:alkylation response protein AidB-like acyl-CoA dehydrogenase
MPTPSAPPLVVAVRRFVEDEVKPVARDLDHADRYPHALVARMRELGLFGCLVPAEYGGLGLPVSVYARVIEELCRGWMSLAGVVNSHTMMALIVATHGTLEQRQRFLPRFARGEARGGLCLTEPHAGSDVQAIRTTARRDGDHYVLDGTKMFITNGREGNAFALLALTDPAAQPRHRGMSCFIVEKGHPGFSVVKSLTKLGYKGVDTVELLFEDVPVPAANLVGGVEGRGFGQVMGGLEAGRINIAARCVGVAQAALEDAVSWARRTGDVPPGLADMATETTAARLITYWAGGMKDRSERCDLEAGMAKLLASEAAQDVAVGAMRVLGEAGVLAEHTVERHYRDTPLMIIGEGTNEIQRTLIARQLVDRYGERSGALLSREGEPDERRQMVLAVRQFVDKELVPVAGELERSGRGPETVLDQLADLGVLGAVVDPDLGGLGLDVATAAMIVEELARGWTAAASAVATHLAATFAIGRSAAGSSLASLLPAMTRGERVGAAVFGGHVVATREDGRPRLDGTTALVDNATRAGVFVLEARVGDRLTHVVVDRTTPGLAVGPVAHTLGQRGLGTCAVVLDAVHVPEGATIDATTGRVRSFACVLTAAIATGLAQAAFEAALRYSQQRSTFGKPIAQHQAVQLKLADMATRITASRLLVAHAAEHVNEPDVEPRPGSPGARASVGGLGGFDSPPMMSEPRPGSPGARASAGGLGDFDRPPVVMSDPRAAMARLWAARVAYETSFESMRIHGGYGYVDEFPIERYYRDAARLGFIPVDDTALRRDVAAALIVRGAA